MTPTIVAAATGKMNLTTNNALFRAMIGLSEAIRRTPVKTGEWS
jgi:hypothetical protein